jgi:hypothetical protein
LVDAEHARAPAEVIPCPVPKILRHCHRA